MTLVVAVNYGSRAEIVHAFREYLREAADAEAAGIAAPVLDEDAIASRLYTADVPDPEVVIRTSGEMRLSNFLLWQSCCGPTSTVTSFCAACSTTRRATAASEASRWPASWTPRRCLAPGAFPVTA